MARRVQVFAHRGAKRVAPENTLPAFAKALEMGVDGIELDVHCSRDGRLVVIHDFTVDRTTDGRGPVASFTAAELARLDVGSHFAPEFAGTGVPTLDEVLDLVSNRCRLNIEIKSTDEEGGPEVNLVADIIRERSLYNQVIISSFNPMSLIKLRWVDNRIPLGLLYEDDLPPHLREAWLSPVLRPEALHPKHLLISPDYMIWAKSIPCAVNTWTVNDAEEARRLADLHVDVIISDVPDLIMAALDEA